MTNRGSKRQQQANVQVKTEQRSISIESGPLPPPAKLQQYDQIVPGAAERIIRMAEEQAAHRRSLESQVIASDVANSRRGQNYGFIIAMVAILGGMVLIYFDKTVVGTWISGGTIASLVAVFAYGSIKRKNERQANQQFLQR